MRKQYILFLSLAALATTQAKTIKHRFIAMDESRSQLHYVDQFDSSNDWTIKFPKRYRDVQLAGDRILVSTHDGYEEYDFKTQAKTKSVTDAEYSKSETITRLPSGDTILGCNIPKKKGGGVRFIELDKNDHPVREVTFPKLHHLRLARLTKDGALLFGCDNRVITARWDGSYTEFATAGEKRHIYEVEELTNDNYRISCGYGAVLEEWTPDGTFVRQLCGGTPPDGFFYLFFGRAQQLSSGHWVVSNWTGHGKDDSRKGAQLIEFDKEGNIAWSWHDPERSGSVHGAIIIE
jgi:hypothetical protein